MVLLLIVAVPRPLAMPAPFELPFRTLPETVLSSRVSLPVLFIPAPKQRALLSAMTTVLRVSVAVLWTPPPLSSGSLSIGSPAGQFAVDRFSISSYFDGEDFTPETVSLLATVAYGSVEFIALGDGDDDGDVDLVDFGAFQRCFSGHEPPATNECASYDFDGDGDVDIDDYSVFQFVGTGPS